MIIGVGKYKRTKEILERQRRAHLGHTSWNKGKPQRESTKEKIRNKAIGRIVSKETKQKISKSLKGIIFTKEHLNKILENLPRGENHPNWKGGLTSLKTQIRNNFKYRQWRSDVFTRDNFTCQYCGKRGIYLEAHHLIEFSNIILKNNITTLEQALNCEELWNINNGQTLCRKCHDTTKHTNQYTILKLGRSLRK